MNKKFLNLKLDVIFRNLFGNEKNEDVIRSFIADLLEIPAETIWHISVSSADLSPEFMGSNLVLNINGDIINIELQINKTADFKTKALYEWSKLYTNGINENCGLATFKKTICINIINFNIFDCKEYHSSYKVMERERREVLTDKFGIHFFELKKVEQSKENKPMEDWLRLISAETEEEIMAIQQTTSNPEVKKAIEILEQISADEQIRKEAYQLEKALLEKSSALKSAKQDGIEEGKMQSKVEIVNNLVSDMDFDLESALKAANITMEQYNKYKEEHKTALMRE